MVKAVFFDLDGTLLPMREPQFTNTYFKVLTEAMEKHGYEKEKFKNAIMEGLFLMLNNNGEKSNEEVFLSNFEKHYGKEKLKDISLFYDFYENEFKKTSVACGYNKYAEEIVKYARNNFSILVLATNPVFPPIAVKVRMGFTKLSDKYFDKITTYDNSRYCKPNPKYFEELLKEYNLKPEEAVVIGNNTKEDIECANLCGIKAYLIGDYLLDPLNLKNPKIYKYEEVVGLLKNIKEGNLPIE